MIFRPKSEIQAFFSPKIRWSPKKKKKVFTKIESDFSAGLVRFRLVGGDASLTGAELIEIEADFSAKIVTFRLVGGMHPPHPPPKSATVRSLPLLFIIAQFCVILVFLLATKIKCSVLFSPTILLWLVLFILNFTSVCRLRNL